MTKVTKEEILRRYLNEISSLMIEYENLANEFPVGIFNELRAMFCHIAKCELASEDIIKNDEISKANRHCIRALRDCYKYLCVAYETIYKQFTLKCNQIFSSVLSKSEKNLLKKIEFIHNDSVEKLTQARQMELDIESSSNDEAIFKSYEKARESYKELYENTKIFLKTSK